MLASAKCGFLTFAICGMFVISYEGYFGIEDCIGVPCLGVLCLSLPANMSAEEGPIPDSMPVMFGIPEWSGGENDKRTK